MQNDGMDDISALVDDELREGELERAVRRLHEPEAAGCWARYHFIRDALRDHVGPLGIGHDLAGRVRTAIAAEPAPLRRNPGARRGAAIGWRPVAALAMAASVAAVAVLFVLEREEVPQPMATVAGTPERALSVAERPRPDLGPYLVNHTEYTRTPSLHGMLPYVRIVSHE